MTSPIRALKQPVDQSMTLLNQILGRPLDAGYQEAAERKAAGLKGPGLAGWSLIVVLALVIGLGVTWGVRALRAPDPASAQARAALVDDSRRQAQEVDELSKTSTTLAAEVEALRHQALAAADPTAAEQSRHLAAATGALAVGGPGVTIRLSQGKVKAASDRIQAGDLRVIVGALWRSGAEAIAVGGVRLTSLSAIRDVGETIQVELQPLAEPYIISAIGQADQLSVGLDDLAGNRLALLKDYFGATVSVETVKQLDLPASAATSVLMYAKPADEQVEEQ